MRTIGYPLQPRRYSRRLIGNLSTWSSGHGGSHPPHPNPPPPTHPWKRKTSCTLTRRPGPLSFTSVFATDDTDRNHDLKMEGPRYQSIPPVLFGNEGILKLLRHVNLSMSSSPDRFAGGMLKEFANELASFLSYLSYKSLETGEVPTKWKVSGWTPSLRVGPRVKLLTADQSVSRASHQSWWNMLYAPTSTLTKIGCPSSRHSNTTVALASAARPITPPYFPWPASHKRQRSANGHWYFGLLQSIWCHPPSETA